MYRDTQTFSSDKTVEFRPKFGNTPLYQHHTTSLVFNDPPRHSRVRRLIAGALTPHAIAKMGGRAGNRDPGVFAGPDRFDIGRSPNRHLAFAAGIHQCVGMSLAWLEGAVAIGRLSERFPYCALASAPVRGMRARFRGFTFVPAVLNA